MNKKLLTTVLLAAVPLFSLVFVSKAMATIELNITDVTTGVTSGNLVGSGGTITFNGAVSNWTINLVTGLSSGPGTSFIDLGSLNAKTATADTLDIELTDNGYTTPTTLFTIQSSGILNACSAGTCSVAVEDFYSNTNTLFAETTQIGGTLGPFSANYATGALTSSATPPNPYSLTMDLLLTETAAGSSNWSTDSSITGIGVPEPASLTLLGSALVGLGWLVRRRRRIA